MCPLPPYLRLRLGGFILLLRLGLRSLNANLCSQGAQFREGRDLDETFQRGTDEAKYTGWNYCTKQDCSPNSIVGVLLDVV